jgi:hypothetical protein
MTEEEQKRYEQLIHRLDKLENHILRIDNTTSETGHTIIGIVNAIRDIEFFYTTFFFIVSGGVVIWLLGDYGHYAFYIFSLMAIGGTIFGWHRHKTREGGAYERQEEEYRDKTGSE